MCNIRYKLTMLATVGLVVSSPITKEQDEVRIVGGEDIDITEAPYQVSIAYVDKHVCGGSIIASDLILTAAHCITSYKPSNYLIRIGSSSSRIGGELYSVAGFTIHPRFSISNLDNDIALMWLSRPVQFSERAAAIEMFEDGEEILDGETVMVTGWGNLKEDGGTPLTLQMVLLPIVNPTECKKAYANLNDVTPRMLCAGLPEGGKDSCQRDSGGPLAYNGRLAGIVSWGIGCARPNYPGVYTKVSALRRWIDETSNYLRQTNTHDRQTRKNA